MACREKRTAGSTVDWRSRRAEIAKAALPIFLQRHWTALSVEEFAEEIGFTYWQVYYSFDGLEDIYRASISQLADIVADAVGCPPTASASVNRTIQDYIRFAATIVRSEAYGQLLFLRLRDAHPEPWVRHIYDTRIAAPLRRGLEQAIAEAGAHNDLKIVLLHGARGRCLMTLEAALALPRLLSQDEFVDEGFERTVSSVAKDMFAATCTFDGFEQGAVEAA